MMRASLMLALGAALLAWMAGEGRAAVYMWTDEKGVAHVTDQAPQTVNRPIEVLGEAEGRVEAGTSGRGKAVRAMLERARARPELAVLRAVAAEYRKTHTYSMADYFVCLDMALELSNILKTRGFSARIVAGNVKRDIAATARSGLGKILNHAWVAVELGPGLNVAVETTAGVLADETLPGFEYYYQGLVFASPREARETSMLIASANASCKAAADLVREWNRSRAGRPVTPEALEAKGRVEARIEECQGLRKRYEDLIGARYRRLY